MVILAIIGIGNGTVFGESDHAVLSGNHRKGLIEPLILGIIILRSRVFVIAYDVNCIGIGIPGRVLPVPYPDEVVQFFGIGQVIVHVLPQGDTRSCSAGAPPEPSAGGFVQGAPEYGDILVFELLEKTRDSIKITFNALEGGVGIGGVKFAVLHGNAEIGSVGVKIIT